MGEATLRRSVLILALNAAACSGGGGGPAASCDEAAEHLIDLCAPSIGEQFRAACEVEGLPPLSPSAATRRCAASIRRCDEASFERCDIRDVIIVCEGDQECPDPFSCDVNRGQCVRCFDDADCGPGRGCLMSLCYDLDSEFFQTLSALFADAGI